MPNNDETFQNLLDRLYQMLCEAREESGKAREGLLRAQEEAARAREEREKQRLRAEHADGLREWWEKRENEQRSRADEERRKAEETHRDSRKTGLAIALGVSICLLLLLGAVCGGSLFYAVGEHRQRQMEAQNAAEAREDATRQRLRCAAAEEARREAEKKLAQAEEDLRKERQRKVAEIERLIEKVSQLIQEGQVRSKKPAS